MRWSEEDEVRSSAVTLDDAVRSFLSQRGYSSAARLADVVACWPDVVGNEVATHVVPWRLTGGELQLAVDDPAWATEVGFLAGDILTGLSDRLRTPVADTVKVHVRPDFNVE